MKAQKWGSSLLRQASWDQCVYILAHCCLEARVSVTCDPVEFTHPGGITQIARFSLQTSHLAEEASRATCQQTAKADFTDLIRNPLKISPGIQHS